MNPTDELLSLCQSQVTLLTQGLAAEWVAVYLAEGLTEDLSANLIPVVIYPTAQSVWPVELNRTELNRTELNRTELPYPVDLERPLLSSLESGASLSPMRSQKSISADSALTTFARNPHQVVLPLIAKGIVLGLLVAGRQNHPWQIAEMSQLEAIAETLAVGCLLDRRQTWYQQQLSRQQSLREIEHNRLDDLLHQLRNPLTALKTFSKLLLKHLWGDDKGKVVAQSILRESDRLRDLLNQFEQNQENTEDQDDPLTIDTKLLPMSPSIALTPSPALALESVDLKALLEPILISAAAIAQEKEIRLRWDLPSDLSPVLASSAALREVLTNLIDNAIKYTPLGGEVHVLSGLKHPEEEQSYLGVCIHDTGYGIPLADRDRIFERHYRGIQAEGSIPGTGLGLAIVKEWVSQMQGKIEMVSPNPFLSDSEYPGTCFTLWLPIA